MSQPVTETNPLGGGAPDLEQQAINQHQKAHVRMQKQLAKSTQKASDIITWLLEDIHISVNKRNKGKVDEDGNPLYNPTKYKENTQLSVAKEFISNNKEFIKAQKELEQAEKQLAKQANTEEVEDEDQVPIIKWDAETTTTNVN